MRLFIAIQLNKEMKDSLYEIQHAMMEQGVRGNFTKKTNLHLTLAFIGKIPSYVLENLPHEEMVVDHISLMRSDRGKNGMIYTEL